MRAQSLMSEPERRIAIDAEYSAGAPPDRRRTHDEVREAGRLCDPRRSSSSPERSSIHPGTATVAREQEPPISDFSAILISLNLPRESYRTPIAHSAGATRFVNLIKRLDGLFGKADYSLRRKHRTPRARIGRYFSVNFPAASTSVLPHCSRNSGRGIARRRAIAPSSQMSMSYRM
jgi:hypothetical protein